MLPERVVRTTIIAKGHVAMLAAGVVAVCVAQRPVLADEVDQPEAAPAADAVETAGAANQQVAASGESAAIAESLSIEVPPTAEEVFVGPPPPPQKSGKVAGKSQTPTRPRVAPDVDLSEPVPLIPELEEFEFGTIPAPVVPELRKYSQPSLVLLDAEVAAGTSVRLSWTPDDGFESIAVPTPVLVVNGSHKGPTLCVTAAVHGDELNGIEVVRRVLYDLDPEELTGAVIGVPIVNLQGFRRGSRYLPDRRDLNRYFPGNTRGSSASRLAHSFFNDVIRHCNALVDVHTGSFHRTNVPQLRADLENPQILELTDNFGLEYILHSAGAEGTLRRAATDAGIPAVTLEAGEPARLQPGAVEDGTRGIVVMMEKLGMIDSHTRWRGKQSVYRRSKWERADQGGVLFSEVDLGDEVERGQLLGTITDPITNVRSEIRASNDGRILGMALPQFVMPGFAAYRIGINTPIMMDIADPNAPSDSDDAIDVEMGDGVLGAADELIDEMEEEFADEGDEFEDHRDYAEDSE